MDDTKDLPAATRAAIQRLQPNAGTPELLEALGDERVSKVASLAHCKGNRTNVWWHYLAYKETLSLHKLGHGYESICTKIRRSYPCPLDSATVLDWIRGRRNPLDRNTIPPTTPDVVYLLAAGIGDGCAKYGGRSPFVHFQHLKDRDFADTIASYSGSRVTSNKSHGYDVVLSNHVLTDLVNAGKSETMIIYPLLRLHPSAALRGFFDAEGGVDPTHGVPRAFNTNRCTIDAFSRLLGELSIHHTITLTKMKPLMVVKGRIYIRRKLLKYGISVSSCCMSRYNALVSFSIRRKAAMLELMVKERVAKQLRSCPADS